MGLGCLLFIFGGLISALLYADAIGHRVQCAKCGYIFRQPPLPRTPVSILATWVVRIVLFFTMMSVLMIAVPALARLVPESPLFIRAKSVVAQNPGAVVLGMLPMLALLVLISLIASFSSNRKAHQKLKKQYETKPKPFPRPGTSTPK